MGHGVKNWQHIVADLEVVKKPGKIFVGFTTDDFHRPDWTFDETQIACLAGRIECSGQYWYPISENLAEVAAKRYQERLQPNASLSLFLKSHLIASYGVFRNVKTALEGKVLYESLKIIADLKARYDVKLMWINDSIDSDLSSDRARDLADKLKQYEITRCFIPDDARLPRDRHPNAQGQDVLKTCVENSLRQW
jgi:hypothetical protein